MDFEASTGWWVLAGLMVLAELLSGTFYLLMMAVGAAAAALAGADRWPPCAGSPLAQRHGDAVP